MTTATLPESQVPEAANAIIGRIIELVQEYHKALGGGNISDISHVMEEMESLVGYVAVRDEWHAQGETPDSHEFAIEFKDCEHDGYELTLLGTLFWGKPVEGQLQMGYAFQYEIKEPFQLSYIEKRALQDFVTALHRSEFLGGGQQ